MRTLRTSWNNSQLDTALRKVNLVKTQELLLEQQQRAITITPIKTCKVCYKRLGQSVISVFPDNAAIHYGCAKIYQSELDKQKEELAALETTLDGCEHELDALREDWEKAVHEGTCTPIQHAGAVQQIADAQRVSDWAEQIEQILHSCVSDWTE